MYWEIRGQINDVGGSLVNLGVVKGNWSNLLREQVIDIACEAESTPELTNAWIVQVNTEGDEIIGRDGLLIVHHLW